MKIFDHIAVSEQSRRPKYRQIVDGIIDNIASGRLRLDEKIPSINAFSEQFGLSRDTVEKAYNVLKERRVITSVKGKGFYVTSLPTGTKSKILFLVNKLSAYKMRIYHSFLNRVGPDVHTDLHIYHCDEKLFVDLLQKNSNAYDYYVVMPHFKTDRMGHTSTTEKAIEAMSCLPEHKLLILDNQIAELPGQFGEVYQDFKDDIYQALTAGREKIMRYKKFVVAFPSQSVYPYPRRILHGFRQFCVEAKMPFEVIEEFVEDMPLEVGTLYLTIPETDLVNLVKAARDQGLTPGKDIGIISYNETPLKDLLGITTVSTDFDAMGRIAADMVLNKDQYKVKNRFNMLHRDSH